MTDVASALRRVVDIAVGVVGLVLASPVLAVVAIAIRFRLGKGVLFRQRRLGKGGRPFEVIKLRTLTHPTPGHEAPEYDAERLTSLGRWLRSTSIDELPSLVNLVRGDITLVGPRPLPLTYWSRFHDEEYVRFEVKPGLTGLAQISGRNTVDWNERLALDVTYVRTRSLLGDLRILIRTVPAVLRGSGVNQVGGVTMYELPADRTSPEKGQDS